MRYPLDNLARRLGITLHASGGHPHEPARGLSALAQALDAGGHDTDRLYLDLLGARERLCRAQTFVPPHWKSDLQAALDHIDLAGSSLCPQQWSRFDQPIEGSA